jgi:hypothetical protein
LRFKGIKDLSSEERSKVLWHSNKVSLIVKAEKCHEAQVKHVIRMLEKVDKKKVVLLAKERRVSGVENFPRSF